MKKSIAIILSLLVAMNIFTGCQSVRAENTGDSADKLKIVTTIFPPYDYVRQIAGDRVELSMLLKPGAESHSFEPTPQDIILIQECDVFIYTGGADVWVDKILDSIDAGGMTLLAMTELSDTVPEEVVEGMEHEHGEDEEHDHEEEHIHSDDEHVWTSPANAKKIVQAITEALCELDEANAAAYTENSASYLSKLDELDKALTDVTSDAARQWIVFGDRFPFRYLADRYGLDYSAAFTGCSTDTEASAATIAYLIDKVESEHIPIVFYIEFSNEKIADTICEATGAKKMLMHSCHNVSRDDFENGVTYLELMHNNVEALRQALN